MAGTLQDLIRDLKTKAMEFGRFPSEYRTPSWFDRRRELRRRGFRPFRCIAYNEIVRQINLVQRASDALDYVEADGIEP